MMLTNATGTMQSCSTRADLQQLRQLRRNALKEQEAGKPPKNFRAIFQALQELDQQGATHGAE